MSAVARKGSKYDEYLQGLADKGEQQDEIERNATYVGDYERSLIEEYFGDFGMFDAIAMVRIAYIVAERSGIAVKPACVKVRELVTKKWAA